jgi:hypothetical protein
MLIKDQSGAMFPHDWHFGEQADPVRFQVGGGANEQA